MNNKIILLMSLMVLVGVVGFVTAIRTEKSYPGTTVTAEFIEQNYHFFKGWNLVQGILNPEWVQSNSKNIRAIYAFNPITKEYVRFYPNPENNKIGETNYQWEFLASIGALWVYSDKDFTSNYWKFADSPLTSIPLYTGWNFIGIASDMKGQKINDIKGSCNIVKVCDYSRQSWDCISEDIGDHTFGDQDSDIGKGLVVKVSNDCKLGESISQVPQLPN